MTEITLTDRKKPSAESQAREPGQPEEEPNWEAPIKRLILTALVCLAASFLVGPGVKFTAVVYHVNEIAEEDVRATRNFMAPDFLATEVKKREAYEAVSSVYNFGPNALESSISSFRSAFAPLAENTTGAGPQETARFIKKQWSVSMTPELAGEMASPDGLRDLEDHVAEILEPYYRQGVVANRDMLIRESERGITVRNTLTGIERPIVEPRNAVDFDEARRELDLNRRREASTIPELARAIASGLLSPNLVLDAELTLKRRNDAAESVSPVLYQVRKGEILVREGDRVTAEQERKLEAHARDISDSGASLNQYFVLFFALLIITTVLVEYGRVNIRKTRISPKDLALVALLFIGMLALQRLGAVFAERMTSGSEALISAIPMAAALITIRIVLNSETALVLAIPFLTAASIGSGGGVVYFFPLAVGSLVGAHVAGKVSRRVEFLRIGLWTGLAQAAATILILGYKGSMVGAQAWWVVGGSFGGGFVSGVAALGLVPLSEAIFGYTTDMRLTELASLDHPLLKDLMLRAPGTYHHSMVTGTLVKGAAEAIGARAVLATVACYFHDIGKISKANYFIENLEEARNPHDKLSPSMSALILIAHVKEGVELAQKYRLGKDITDIIAQHHGTSLIRYFYQKALESARPGVDEVGESEYRYPGPKPQTREAGLVMLADAVEAAARSLPDPKPARIQGAVQNIINRIFADGQLDECDLSLKDLHKIARSFMRTLNAIHHHRIDYPLAAHKEKKDDGSTDPKRHSPAGAKRSEARGESEESLKRLGM